MLYGAALQGKGGALGGVMLGGEGCARSREAGCHMTAYRRRLGTARCAARSQGGSKNLQEITVPGYDQMMQTIGDAIQYFHYIIQYLTDIFKNPN